MTTTVEKVIAGKMSWPALNIKDLNPDALTKETARDAMKLVFRVVGINAELLVKMTGFWSPSGDDQQVLEKAKALCILYQG